MNKVRLGHLDFRIIEMDKVSANESYGLYLSEAQEIHLSKGMTKRRGAEVLLHELMHGIVDHQNLGHLLKDIEEPVVRGMALGLASLMRDNQRLFAEMLKALK